MGNAKKKKKDRDFKKVKLKVGKKLKKANATDTRIETKKIVLIEQLQDDKKPETSAASTVASTVAAPSATTTKSHRGLSLDDLCRQLGHFNTNVRKDAIVGVTQLLGDNKELMSKYLRTIIPAVARLIADGKNDTTTTNQLKALLTLVFTTPARIMSAHFELLVTHTLRAFTHIQLSVRVLALKVIVMLLRAYPQLCRDSVDLFDAFIRLMGSQRRPGSKELLIGAMEDFISVYTVVDRPKTEPMFTTHIDFTKGRITKPLMVIPRLLEPFDFSVMGPSLKQQTSPLMTVDGFLLAIDAIFPLLLVIMTVDDGQVVSPFMKRSIGVTKMLLEVLETLKSSGTIEDTLPKISKSFSPIGKFAEKQGNERFVSMLKSANVYC